MHEAGSIQCRCDSLGADYLGPVMSTLEPCLLFLIYSQNSSQQSRLDWDRRLLQREATAKDCSKQFFFTCILKRYFWLSAWLCNVHIHYVILSSQQEWPLLSRGKWCAKSEEKKWQPRFYWFQSQASCFIDSSSYTLDWSPRSTNHGSTLEKQSFLYSDEMLKVNNKTWPPKACNKQIGVSISLIMTTLNGATSF